MPKKHRHPHGPLLVGDPTPQRCLTADHREIAEYEAARAIAASPANHSIQAILDAARVLRERVERGKGR